MGWKTANAKAVFPPVEKRRGDTVVDDRGVYRRERREALTAIGAGRLVETFWQMIGKPRNHVTPADNNPHNIVCYRAFKMNPVMTLI